VTETKRRENRGGKLWSRREAWGVERREMVRLPKKNHCQQVKLRGERIGRCEADESAVEGRREARDARDFSTGVK